VAAPLKPPQRPGAPAQPETPEDKRHATDELADACAALETEVEELKVKYEMWFLGVERSEPNKIREELKKKVARLKERFTRNAGIRFRIQSLHARFISYERLWLRSVREKEEGTYRRDVFKARLHARQRGVGPAGVKGKKEVLRHTQAEDVDLSDFGDEEAPAPVAAPAPTTPAARPAAPAAGAPAARPAAAAPAPAARPATPVPPAPPLARPAPSAHRPAAGGVDAQTRALYEAYVAARKSCNQDLAGITPDAIARTIAKQTPEILKTHKASRVEFKVEVRDGKAILKAIPRS
jgi:FtsZ-binding cell division protein ZapB